MRKIQAPISTAADSVRIRSKRMAGVLATIQNIQKVYYRESRMFCAPLGFDEKVLSQELFG
jgi:hypothetical protein